MITFADPIPLSAPGLTVTAHDGASYVLSDGRTLWASPPAADTPPETIAAEVETLLANPPPPPAVAGPRSAPSSLVVDRLTDTELAALYNSTHPAAIRAVLLATSEGVISEAHPAFAGLVAALDALGIIAAARWDALLAAPA